MHKYIHDFFIFNSLQTVSDIVNAIDEKVQITHEIASLKHNLQNGYDSLGKQKLFRLQLLQNPMNFFAWMRLERILFSSFVHLMIEKKNGVQ